MINFKYQLRLIREIIIYKEDAMKTESMSRGRALLGFLLAILMLLSCASALGEAGPGSKDYGDFTLTWPANSYLQDGTKADGQVLFTVFPDYDASANAHPNLNGSWSSSLLDYSLLTDDILVLAAQESLNNNLSAMEAQGLSVENAKVIMAEITTLSGKKAYSYMYAMDVDYSKLGLDLKASIFSKQYLVSDPSFKSYAFTLTAFDETGINKLDSILHECITFK